MASGASTPYSEIHPYVPGLRQPLPTSPNRCGRPVWEPPLLDYHWLTGEEYDKKKEAVLKYYKNDIVKTTKFLDIDIEYDLLDEYLSWISDNMTHDKYGHQWPNPEDPTDPTRLAFFQGLHDEVYRDRGSVVGDEYLPLKMCLEQEDDGTYIVMRKMDGYKYLVADYLEHVSHHPSRDEEELLSDYEPDSSFITVGERVSLDDSSMDKEEGLRNPPNEGLQATEEGRRHFLNTPQPAAQVHVESLPSTPALVDHSTQTDEPLPKTLETTEALDTTPLHDLLSLWW